MTKQELIDKLLENQAEHDHEVRAAQLSRRRATDTSVAFYTINEVFFTREGVVLDLEFDQITQ